MIVIQDYIYVSRDLPNISMKKKTTKKYRSCFDKNHGLVVEEGDKWGERKMMIGFNHNHTHKTKNNFQIKPKILIDDDDDIY